METIFLDKKSCLDEVEIIAEKDRLFAWHPFTQAMTAHSPIPISKGKGAYLFDYDGKQYFDAISSWWVTIHGHAHPYIAKKISQQAHQLEQVIFADFTHSPAAHLAQRLVNLLHHTHGKVFFSDNGSTAVETALKIAIQYHFNKSPWIPKTKIVSFRKGYHGDTFGAMSSSGITPFNRPFWPLLFEIKQIDPPAIGQEMQSQHQLESLLKQGDIACFIFEPIIQGVGGMHTHSPEGLDALLEICHQYGVITIADEVMTGFGRTGPLFACDRIAQRPDITCLSKGLTGGFLPLGATVCKEEIYEGFLSDKLEKALLHGHSYCGNPIACAAALANLDLLEEDTCTRQRQNIEQQHRTFLESIAEHPRVARCEVVGTILILELRDTEEHHRGYFTSKRDKIIDFFLHNGIVLRPFGNVLHLMPPYCSSIADLHHTYNCINILLESNL